MDNGSLASLSETHAVHPVFYSVSTATPTLRFGSSSGPGSWSATPDMLFFSPSIGVTCRWEDLRPTRVRSSMHAPLTIICELPLAWIAHVSPTLVTPSVAQWRRNWPRFIRLPRCFCRRPSHQRALWEDSSCGRRWYSSGKPFHGSTLTRD